MACIQAQGSTLTIEDGGGTPITIGSFMSWDGLNGSSTIIDCTDLASTAKEKIQGLQDFGSFTIEVNWDGEDLGQQECLLAKTAQATRTMVLTVGGVPSLDIGVATFDAFVVSVDVKGGQDDKVSRTITFEVTGAAVWTDVA